VCVLIVAALHCIFRNLRTWPAESWDAWGAPSAACNAGNGATAPLAPMPGWLGKMCESGHQNLRMEHVHQLPSEKCRFFVDLFDFS
jgi:hypothetical protein